MSSILDTRRPEALVDELDLDELLTAVTGMEGWTPRRLKAVDYVLRAWTSQTAGRQDARSVAELQSVIGRIVERQAPPDKYADRWQAFDDVLESHRVTLTAKDPERVRNMKHVRGILDFLDVRGKSRQGDLIERLALKISVSRLSQIVNLMEANGLIVIERQGRESYLMVPVSERAAREHTTRHLLSREHA